MQDGIEGLINRYRDLRRLKGGSGIKELSEANVRSDFIDPLFEILGWDTSNPEEYDREYSLKHGGRADVALKIDGKPVIFIEAKRFGGIPHIDERGDADWLLEERQAILYAAKEGAKWAILTNFEKFRVFNARTGLTILDFETITDYIDRIGELQYLTKEAVVTGRIERLAERKERPDVDLEFLKLLDKWRLALANDIYERNRDNEVLRGEDGELDLDRLKDAVQRTLDRLIIIRWAEDNLVLEDPNILQRKYNDWKLSPSYCSIVDSLFADRALFDRFNEIHDGKIFERGHICDQVIITDEVLGQIINEMNSISFRKFDFDILGNTYETYLGHTLYLREDGTIGLKPSREVRKESGIYYTPPYVVDYIIKNTLGELLKGKTLEEVEKIKVLDPACGSGSFLIKAFDYFKDYDERENERIREEREKRIREYLRSGGNQLKLDMDALEWKEERDVERKILKNNIFGVDLDRQAAEIASVNLMLKALKPNEKLPLILDENIRVGNSLISGSEEELRRYFGEKWKEKRPFNWEEEFSEIFDENKPEEERGFDVVVGNPPWGANIDDLLEFFEDKYPDSTQHHKDSFKLFIDRALQLTKTHGYVGMIVPSAFLFQPRYLDIRRLLRSHKIVKIVNLGERVFENVDAPSCIFIVEKEPDDGQNKVNLLDLSSLKDNDAKERSLKSPNYVVFPQKLYTKTAGESFVFFYRDLKDNEVVLGDVLKCIDAGINYQRVGCGMREKGKSDLAKRLLYEGKQQKESDVMYYKGEDIDPYFMKERTDRYVRPYFEDFIKENEVVRLNKKVYEKVPKLLWRQTADRIIATIDYKGVWFGRSIQTGFLNEEYENKLDLRYILALLNSKYLNYIHEQIAKERGRVYAQVKLAKIKQLPIKLASPSQQKPIIELVDRMLNLNKELHKINTDFDRYVSLYPRVKDSTLKDYIKNLPVSDKEVLKDHYGKPINQIQGKIKAFEIIEEGEWLVFKVGYIFKTRKGKEALIENVRAFRCRIEDLNLRKFLYYSIKEYITPGKIGKGNIYERILKIKVPRFSENEEENRKIIDELMEAYLKEVEKRERLEREIEKTDREIDRRVYDLYGLSEEEIRVVEGSEK